MSIKSKKEEIDTSTLKSITDEERKEIEQLQINYNNTIFQIGELSTVRKNLEMEIEKIDKILESYYECIREFIEEEQNIIQKLETKYGESNLNL